MNSVRIAFDGDVEDRETGLGGVEDLPGEEDGAGAGSEDWFLLSEGFQDVEEAVPGISPIQKSEHGCRFAAGKHESVETFEGFRGFDQGGKCA